jgi:hypothetical protein
MPLLLHHRSGTGTTTDDSMGDSPAESKRAKARLTVSHGDTPSRGLRWHLKHVFGI